MNMTQGYICQILGGNEQLRAQKILQRFSQLRFEMALVLRTYYTRHTVHLPFIQLQDLQLIQSRQFMDQRPSLCACVKA